MENLKVLASDFIFLPTGVSLFQASVIAFFVVVFLFSVGKRRKKSSLPQLAEEEKDEIIASWNPEPLVPIFHQNKANELMPLPIEGKVSKYATIDGKRCLNMATADFLGFVGHPRIENVAKETIRKYGVGSCGPRSFYGTVDVHIELEKQLAEFMGCEEAILYSYGFAAISSAISAYAKRGDIIFADKGVNFAIQKGIQASRSKVYWFEHNDLRDLERLLKEQDSRDETNRKSASKIRRFIIVEGLYAKTADLCPLPGIVDLKWRYKARIFLDESYSFGIISKTGRGVTEFFGIDVINIDMIMSSLENAIASTGGFCCGRKFLIEHQRLSGLGYCFSASLPPFLATAAGEALKILEEEPERIERLHQNARTLHQELIEATKNTCFSVLGVEESPLKNIVSRSVDSIDEIFNRIVNGMLSEGILITRSKYLEQSETFPPRHSIKIACGSELSIEELNSFVDKFKSIISSSTIIF